MWSFFNGSFVVVRNSLNELLQNKKPFFYCTYFHFLPYFTCLLFFFFCCCR